MGPTGDIGIQEESYGRGGHFFGAEEKQSKSRGVQGGNGRVLSLSPHGENKLDSTSTDQGSRLWQRGTGDIHGVLSLGTEVGGVPSIWMCGKGKQLRETQITLHVSALEDEGGIYKGDNVTAT